MIKARRAILYRAILNTRPSRKAKRMAQTIRRSLGMPRSRMPKVKMINFIPTSRVTHNIPSSATKTSLLPPTAPKLHPSRPWTTEEVTRWASTNNQEDKHRSIHRMIIRWNQTAMHLRICCNSLTTPVLITSAKSYNVFTCSKTNPRSLPQSK